MSKKYKGKLCVYCTEDKSATADHVIAREFFREDQRGNFPKVPACRKCNGKKSALEHYLTTILPFGGRHPDALVNLSTMVPKRLQGNAKLRAKLSVGFEESALIVQTPTGNWERTASIPIDHVPLEQLFAFIARGLAWHHWGVLLGPGYSAIAAVLSDAGTEFIDHFLFARKSRNHVNVTLGHDTFIYEGLQAIDDDRLTAWRFLIYGGVSFGGDPKLPGHRGSQIVAVTGPNALIQRLEATVFSEGKSATGPNEVRDDGCVKADISG